MNTGKDQIVAHIGKKQNQKKIFHDTKLSKKGLLVSH